MKGTDVLKKIRNLFELFIICCFLGWVYESVWWMMVELNYKFVNRGFLLGPWLPIYGAGMLIVSFVFDKLKIKKGWQIFLFGTLIATAFELLGSYIAEWVTGEQLWTYEDMFLNFQGRIALKPDIYFGLLILLGVYGVKPGLEKMQQKYDNSVVHNVICGTVAAVFLADVIYSVINLFAK